MNNKQEFSGEDDDRVVFVPEEEIWAIERIYHKMQLAQQEFRKVAEDLKMANRE